MLKSFIGMQIEKNIEEQIIEVTNQYSGYVHVSSVEECEKLILINFSVYFDNSEGWDDIYVVYMRILTEKAHFTKNEFFIRFYIFLQKNLPDIMVVDIYQNMDIEKGEFDTHDKLLEQARKEAIEDTKALLSVLEERIFRPQAIVKNKDLNHLKEKEYLDNTYNVIKSFNFTSETYMRVVRVFEEIISGKRYKTFLKNIRKANLGYITCDKAHGIYYIHLVNLVYGYVYLEKIWSNNNDITSALKSYIQSIPDDDGSLFSGEIKSLTFLKEEIRKDQILEYVCKRYFKIYLDEASLEDYKKLIAKIFDKDVKGMWEKDLQIDDDGVILRLFYHSTLEQYNKLMVPMESFCIKSKA